MTFLQVHSVSCVYTYVFVCQVHAFRGRWSGQQHPHVILHVLVLQLDKYSTRIHFLRTLSCQLATFCVPRGRQAVSKDNRRWGVGGRWRMVHKCSQDMDTCTWCRYWSFRRGCSCCWWSSDNAAMRRKLTLSATWQEDNDARRRGCARMCQDVTKEIEMKVQMQKDARRAKTPAKTAWHAARRTTEFLDPG